MGPSVINKNLIPLKTASKKSEDVSTSTESQIKESLELICCSFPIFFIIETQVIFYIKPFVQVTHFQ